MVVYIKLFLTAVVWGGTFIAGRIVAQDVGPFSAAFFRFLVASACLLLIVRQRQGHFSLPARRQWLAIILLGMTGVFAYNVFFFKGLRLINAGRAAVIVACNPILIALLAAWLFKEKFNLVKVMGIFLSVCGAVVVITRGKLGPLMAQNIGWGEVYIMACVLSWAAYALIGKAVLADLSPLVAVCYATVAGTLLLFWPACREGALTDWLHYSRSDWLGILYLGIFGTVLGFVWYYEGIQKIGPTRASLFINFVPASAVLMAFLILGEPLTPSLLVGALLVIAGVYLTNTTLPAKNRPVAAAGRQGISQ